MLPSRKQTAKQPIILSNKNSKSFRSRHQRGEKEKREKKEHKGRKLKESASNDIPAVIGGAISSGQRKRHTKWVAWLRQISCAVDAVQKLDAMRKRNRWKWSTTSTKVGEIIGAIKRAEIYHFDPPFKATDAVGVEYQRKVGNETLQEAVAYPRPLQKEEVMRVIHDKSVAQEVRSMLAIMWSTTARPNCVLHLQARNVTLEGQKMSVLFTEGKGVLMRRTPYVVHTRVGAAAPLV